MRGATCDAWHATREYECSVRESSLETADCCGSVSPFVYPRRRKSRRCHARPWELSHQSMHAVTRLTGGVSRLHGHCQASALRMERECMDAVSRSYRYMNSCPGHCTSIAWILHDDFVNTVSRPPGSRRAVHRRCHSIPLRMRRDFMYVCRRVHHCCQSNAGHCEAIACPLFVEFMGTTARPPGWSQSIA